MNTSLDLNLMQRWKRATLIIPKHIRRSGLTIPTCAHENPSS